MVTFTDTAMAGYAELALSLASCGCPWLQAEAQRLLQVWTVTLQVSTVASANYIMHSACMHADQPGCRQILSITCGSSTADHACITFSQPMNMSPKQPVSAHVL